MSKRRDWFWEIRAMGQGPDFHFLAEFEPSDAERLAAIVREQLPSGYRRNDDLDHLRGASGFYDCYIDQHTLDRLSLMRESGVEESIWYHGEVEVRDNQFFANIFLTGSGYGETDLIAALTQSSELSLRYWRVAYGGYSWAEVASGTTAAELWNYLHEKAD